MSRLIDFSREDENSIVERVLIRVHKAIDKNFPNADKPSQEFAETVFKEEDTGEVTQKNFVDMEPTNPTQTPAPEVEKEELVVAKEAAKIDHGKKTEDKPISMSFTEVDSTKITANSSEAVSDFSSKTSLSQPTEGLGNISQGQSTNWLLPILGLILLALGISILFNFI